MSNNDSFIDEVTEELQRDRLYAQFRKYGWIAVLLVVLIVGGASFNEYRKSQAASKAQAAGDVLVDSLEAEDPAVREIGLEEVASSGADGALLAQFLLAAEQTTNDKRDAALATYAAIANDPEAAQIYKDLAELKSVQLEGNRLTADARRARLEAIAAPGAAFRLLAEEELGYIEVASGQTDAAITRFQAILQDAEVTQGLRRRLTQAIVALGGSLEAPAQEAQ